MVRRREIEPLWNVGDDILKKVDPHGHRFKSRAVAVWPEVAGDEIVKHTKGVALRDGELIVYVDSPVWANELTMLTERFKSDINAKLGEELVKSLRFNVSRKVTESQVIKQQEAEEADFYKPDTTRAIPLSEEERQQAAYIADAVPDSELREKALRVMIKDLEWKKGLKKSNAPQNGAEKP